MQKKLLDEWLLFAKRNNTFILIGYNIEFNESFPDDLLAALEKINDYETIVQDINRYINDQIAAAINARK